MRRSAAYIGGSKINYGAIRGAGHRCALGFDVGDSEGGAFWTAFLRGLKARGLHGVQLVISHAHAGLKQAIEAVVFSAAWQRCQVHFLRNVLAQIPKGHAEMVAAAIRTISPNPTATKSITIGDFGTGCKIVERLGMSVELIPHMLGTHRLPLGVRGLYVYWRTGAGVIAPNA